VLHLPQAVRHYTPATTQHHTPAQHVISRQMPSTKTPCCTFPRLCATIHQPPHNAMVPNSSTHLGHTLPLLPANTSHQHLVQVVQIVRECALLAHPPTWITSFHSCLPTRPPTSGQVVQVVRECALLAHPPTWITPFHSCLPTLPAHI